MLNEVSFMCLFTDSHQLQAAAQHEGQEVQPAEADRREARGEPLPDGGPPRRAAEAEQEGAGQDERAGPRLHGGRVALRPARRHLQVGHARRARHAERQQRLLEQEEPQLQRQEDGEQEEEMKR